MMPASKPPRCAVFPIGRSTNKPMIKRGIMAAIGKNHRCISKGMEIFRIVELKENIEKSEIKM